MDELSGRQVAKSVGLEVIGSVGILIRAKQVGLIESVSYPLNQMAQAGI
jgi:predicted nucleic acid-binding protein